MNSIPKFSTLQITAYFLLVSFSALHLVSCSKEDEKSNSERIIGVWKEEKRMLNNKVHPYEEPCDSLETLEFKVDKTYYVKELEFIEQKCTATEPSLGSWRISDNILSLVTKQIAQLEETGTYNLEILRLTDSELQIKYLDIDVNDEGLCNILCFC